MEPWGADDMSPDNDKGTFGPKTLKILDTAYKEARRRLQRDPSKANVGPEHHTLLAQRIMHLAKSGERSISELVSGALSGWRGRR